MIRTRLLATAALGTTLLVGAAGVTTMSVAGAQGTDTAPAAEAAASAAGPRHLQHRPLRRAVVRETGRVAADTIGVEPSELRQAWRDGQSIAEVATANGVEPQAVVDAVVADLSARLDQAVAEGRVDAERAETAKERVPDPRDPDASRPIALGSRGGLPGREGGEHGGGCARGRPPR